MPRAQKRPPLDATPTGMPYGTAGQLDAANRDAQTALAAGSPTPGSGVPVPAPPGSGGPPSGPPPEVLAAALAEAPPTAAWGPDMPSNPDIPLTAGIRSGPGPGPEAMTPGRDPVADLLDHVAAVTGDPFPAHLAQRARARR